MPAPADIAMPDDKVKTSTGIRAKTQSAAELLVKCLDRKSVV